MRHFLFGKAVMIILTEKADCKMFIVILWSYNKDFDAASSLSICFRNDLLEVLKKFLK